MDNREIKKINDIKDKISRYKVEKIKKETLLEQIKEKWKKKYGTDDVSEIKVILKNLNEKYDELEEKQKKLYDEIINAYDWESLE